MFLLIRYEVVTRETQLIKYQCIFNIVFTYCFTEKYFVIFCYFGHSSGLKAQLASDPVVLENTRTVVAP